MTTANLLTAATCLRVLGDPVKEKDMVVWDVPAVLEIGAIPKKIYCNKHLVAPLTAAFKALIKTGSVKELKTWDGCFCIRKKRGSPNSMSLHSWGLAIDLNASWNQFGKQPNLSPAFVKCFVDNGFTWGGTWSKPDGMHFQLTAAKFAG